MKHLSGLHQTFPHLPSREAIMGVVQKKKTVVELAEEEVETKQRSSQFVTVKVYFTIRPYLPPCHCAVISLPLPSRCSELHQTAWALFTEHREKMGAFLGPPPSENSNDYMLCFMNHTTSKRRHDKLVVDLTKQFEAIASGGDGLRSPSPKPGGGGKDGSPGTMSLENSPAKGNDVPLSIDELLSVTGAPPVPPAVVTSNSSTPAAVGLEAPRRRSRSNSVMSSSTVVTDEPLGGEDEEADRNSDVGHDDGHGGESTAKVVSVVDVALNEYRAMPKVSQLVCRSVPSIQHCEECPAAAIVSRLVVNRMKKKAEGGDGFVDMDPERGGQLIESNSLQHMHREHHDVEDGIPAFHLMLKPLFLEREAAVLAEEKTRQVTMRVYELSWTSLLVFEDKCRQQTKVYEVRRSVEVSQIKEFEEKEHQLRVRTTRTEHSTWVDMLETFKRRYVELEVGMIAQYRQIRELRARHLNHLKQMGFTPDDDR